jgi:hypothetical protein
MATSKKPSSERDDMKTTDKRCSRSSPDGGVAEAICHRHTNTIVVRWTLAAPNEGSRSRGPAEPTTAREAMANQQQHHQVTPDQTNRRDN